MDSVSTHIFLDSLYAVSLLSEGPMEMHVPVLLLQTIYHCVGTIIGFCLSTFKLCCAFFFLFQIILYIQAPEGVIPQRIIQLYQSSANKWNALCDSSISQAVQYILQIPSASLGNRLGIDLHRRSAAAL